MKNQYFGDINDYLKYGLLRVLTYQHGLTLAVCWMLTPDSPGRDGRNTRYLGDARKWRAYDPSLFDALHFRVRVKKYRSVLAAAVPGILPYAELFEALVPDGREQRHAFFAAFRRMSRFRDLVFFDPDNGMEVASRPPGRKDSNKHLLWTELETTFGDRHCVLVYQHFRRVPRERFIEEMACKMLERTGAPEAFVFRTPHVGFFLLVQEPHRAIVRRKVEVISRTWAPHIVLAYHRIEAPREAVPST